jgi:ABC-2 type transport system permease protein
MIKFNKQSLKHYFDFLWVMTEKELKVHYKGSVIGFLWVIINPFLQMLIIGVIFSFFIKIPNYFLFLFTGLLPWMFFSLSVLRTTQCFVSERSLLQKAKFNFEVIPISIVLANFISVALGFFVLIVALFLIGTMTIEMILITLIALLWLFLFTIGFSLFTSTLHVKFRDTSFIVQAGVLMWFYLTPVLYGLNLIPAKAYPLFALNPLTSIFELLHLSITGQGYIKGYIIALNVLISVLAIALGVYYFKKENRFFVDNI